MGGRGDGIALNRRLNLFCNVFLETYKTAKSKSPAHVSHWFYNAFSYAYCIDARSMICLAYATLQEDNKDFVKPYNLHILTKEQVRDEFVDYLGNFQKSGEELSAEKARGWLNPYIGVGTKEGALTQKDIQDYIDYCENILYLW